MGYATCAPAATGRGGTFDIVPRVEGTGTRLHWTAPMYRDPARATP